jgi:hypothetical protein
MKAGKHEGDDGLNLMKLKWPTLAAASFVFPDFIFSCFPVENL